MSTEISTQFAHLLRQAREAAGMSQAELAQKAGFGRNSIINWETGVYSPKLSDIDKLAAALSIESFSLLRVVTLNYDRLLETEGKVIDAQDSVHTGEELLRFEYRPFGERAAAGDGADNEYPDTETVEEMVRTRDELARFGFSGAGLKAFFVAGPSMEPEIRANTPALMVPMSDFEASGVYVLTMDRWTIVKVVDLLAGGAIRVSSKNKEEYPDAEILIPQPEADTPNTYRSQLTGLITRVKVEGRVVLYTKTT